MPDLMKEFLDRADFELTSLDDRLPRLERNPSDQEIWDALESFLAFVRDCSPFLEMERCSALSEAALDELCAYREGRLGLKILPDVLMKFRRLKKIISSVAKLGREPRESDDDLLPVPVEAEPVPDQMAEKSGAWVDSLREEAEALNSKEREIAAQESALDTREEELVVWAQSLSEQDAFLKARENKLFENEQKYHVSESTLQEEYARIQEYEKHLDERRDEQEHQDKILKLRAAEAEQAFADLEERSRENQKGLAVLREREQLLAKRENELHALEEELVQSQMELHRDRDDLKAVEEEYEMQHSLLKDKEKLLKEQNVELSKMKEDLAAKLASDEHIETELRLVIQQQKQKIVEVEEKLSLSEFKLQNTEKELFQTQKENLALKHESDDLKLTATDTGRELERIRSEQRDFIEQHRLLNDENVELQQELARRKAAIDREREELKRRTATFDRMKEELEAVGWPFNADGLRDGLADLAKSQAAIQNLLKNSYNVQKLASFKNINEAFLIFKKHVADLRSRSLRGIYDFVRQTAEQKSEKYRRAYEIDWELPESFPVADLQADSALRGILSHLIDNAFKYAVLAAGLPLLRLFFSVRTDGAFLNFYFADNGSKFSVNALREEIVNAGVLGKAEVYGLSDDEALQYLFHPRILHARSDKRGLLAAHAALAVCGGRIKAVADNGFGIYFSMPVSYLFGRVLGFKIGRCKLLLPLGAVIKTLAVSSDSDSFCEQNGAAFFSWNGGLIPVLDFPPASSDKSEYVIILQAGAFYVALKADQVWDTQEIASMHPEKSDKETPFLLPCVTLESGAEYSFLDVARLLHAQAPLLTEYAEDKEPEPAPSKLRSYLIFKSAPHTFGAVRIGDVKSIEDFSGPKKDLETNMHVFETGGKSLPLRDAAPQGRFAFSKTVLVLEGAALAIQEVTDILDIPVSEDDENVEFVVYKGAQVPVFPQEDKP